MEDPLLTEDEHNVDNVTIHGDSSSNYERILDITINDNSSSADLVAIDWNLVEFVVTLVQLVAAIVVLTSTKDEQHPKKIYVMLIISYTCGCVATLPILGWRFLHYNRSVCSDTRINEVMDNLKMMIGYFFVGWITVLLWQLVNNSSSLDNTTPHFGLCLAFLAISCILHVFGNFYCSVVCFLLPLLSRLIKLVDFIDDIDDKLTYLGLVLFVCISICMCICTCCR